MMPDRTIPLLPRLLGWQVRLPLPVVVMYEGEPGLNHLPIGLTAASQLQAFYRSLGIDIQPQVSARILPEWPHGAPQWADEVMRTHRFHLGGYNPTLIVRSDASAFPSLDGGSAWGEALGAVAATVGQSVGGVQHPYLAEIAIHEVAHLLGVQHESGTFSDPDVRKLREYDVSPEQRRTLRESAYRYGGF